MTKSLPLSILQIKYLVIMISEHITENMCSNYVNSDQWQDLILINAFQKKLMKRVFKSIYTNKKSFKIAITQPEADILITLMTPHHIIQPPFVTIAHNILRLFPKLLQH